ncbi:NAD-dependent epimerase/dehydratase family protein [Candidatus Methylopumilus rimovensis]|uniref:NAD-dependent epimerase/dehydratase family protein n=1 Tax=Candidatus Methylopumilus rimovensis TaxID=2588535 RepID=UPI001652760E|nr:NAD(P)-dependent oxidoreductase [Candidatus Methylopumilus rimovensis]
MQKTHIFITGANGFVGRHLLRMLIARKIRVSIAVRSGPEQNLPFLESYKVDLTDKIKVFDLINFLKPDYVIHLAAKKNRNNNLESFGNDYNANFLMALNLINACRNLLNLKRFVFLGSCDEYGFGPRPYSEGQNEFPSNAYGLSKLSISKLLLSLYHTDLFPSIVLRASIIYGPEQNDEMFLPSLIHSLLSDKDFQMTLGEQFRDFVYINDVINAIIKVLSADERVNGKIINIGFGVSHKINHIAEMTANLIAPTALRRLKFGEVEYRPNEIMDYSLKISLASDLLGWNPKVNIEEGIRKTVNHLKKSNE